MFYRFFLSFSVLWLLLGSPAFAHWADMAALEITLQEHAAEAELTVATPFFDFADVNKNGRLETTEFQSHQKAIEDLLQRHITLARNNEKARLSARMLEGVSQEGFSLLGLQWQWAGKTEVLTLSYTLFDPEAVNAHCLVSVQQADKVSSWVLKPTAPQISLQDQSRWQQVQKFVILGLEHILTGYDHLLFLFALLMVGERFRYLAKIITTFTLAHSITLSLAVLGWVYAPSRLIETLIAASIVYVLIVDVIWKKREASAGVVFGFGLIHGLGFASILKEMVLPVGQRTLALVSFNLGLEAGQLVLAGLFWSFLMLLRKQERLNAILRPTLAYAALILACIWCAERVL